jgi:hypothetical protein
VGGREGGREGGLPVFPYGVSSSHFYLTLPPSLPPALPPSSLPPSFQTVQRLNAWLAKLHVSLNDDLVPYLMDNLKVGRLGGREGGREGRRG